MGLRFSPGGTDSGLAEDVADAKAAAANVRQMVFDDVQPGSRPFARVVTGTATVAVLEVGV